MDLATRVIFPVAHTDVCPQISSCIIVQATIPPFQPATMKKQIRRFPAGLRAGQGFTLLEVLVSMFLFFIVSLGVYSALVKSYQLLAMARNRDYARAVLESFSDQFLRLGTTYVDGSGVTQTLPLFQVTDTSTYPSGTGSTLNWTYPGDGVTVSGTDPGGLQVILGSLASSGAHNGQVTATVTEIVSNLLAPVPPNGAMPTQAAVTPTAAGQMLQAQFTITYTVGNIPCSYTLVVARCVP
jgi:prepilin-type N-terminal cleavage/methylation domain-containing protein